MIVKHPRKFVYHGPNEHLFDGVIAHLTRECCGNVHNKLVVNITSNTVWNNIENYHSKNAADFDSSSWYLSEVDDDPWICYDFKRRVISTSYSVKAEEVRYCRSE